MRVHSQVKIAELKRLRRRGYSVQELTKILGIPKTTVWHHVQSVTISSKYRKILRSKQGGSKNRSVQEWEKAAKKAKLIVRHIGRVEKILVAAALYWGEGSKRDFSISNTDPELIKTFVTCLKAMGVNEKDMRVSVRLYEDIDKTGAIAFWEKITGAPVRSINILKGKKQGKLAYGMCRLRVAKGGPWLKLLKSVKNEIISKVVQSPRSSMDRAPHS